MARGDAGRTGRPRILTFAADASQCTEAQWRGGRGQSPAYPSSDTRQNGLPCGISHGALPAYAPSGPGKMDSPKEAVRDRLKWVGSCRLPYPDNPPYSGCPGCPSSVTDSIGRYSVGVGICSQDVAPVKRPACLSEAPLVYALGPNRTVSAL